MTLARLKEALKENYLVLEDGKHFPAQQAYLERRRPYVERGELVPLFQALVRCRWPHRRGFAFEDAALNPDLDQSMLVCEIPRWLLDELCRLVLHGLVGRWPKGKARHARAYRRALDFSRDLARAMGVLEARDAGVAWEEVWDKVSSTVAGAGSPRAVEAAYRRVLRVLRDDPDPLRLLMPPRNAWDDLLPAKAERAKHR